VGAVAAAFILGKKEKGCILCNRLAMKDSVENLILYRGEKNFIILNKYPTTRPYADCPDPACKPVGEAQGG